MLKRTLTGKVALALFVVTVVVITVSFCTRNWLASDGRFYGARLDKLGLWVHCFRSLPDPNDEYQRRFFTGCRWVYDPFTKGYADIRGFLLPAFFVAVQVFFTFCFTLLLAACVMVLMLILCIPEDREIGLLRIIAIDLGVSAVCGTIAVIVFGALGDSRHYMPDYEHNYLSWSFGLGVVGVFLEYVAAILFWVESRIQNRKLRTRQAQGVFSMEATKA